MQDLIASLISDSRLAFIQGKYDESLKLAKQALAEDENSADAHQCAGNAYMSKVDYESAIDHYKRAIENDADNGDCYFNLLLLPVQLYPEKRIYLAWWYKFHHKVFLPRP